MNRSSADFARFRDIAATMGSVFRLSRQLSLQGKTTDAAHAQMGALALMEALRREAQVGELAG
jgi:hypothetical protein